MGNQLDKKYGYERDMKDIKTPGQIPTDVTGNAIDFYLVDHPAELELGNEPHDGAIKNHDYILDTPSVGGQVFLKGQLDEFDADLRDNAAAASGSIEHQTLPDEPTDPSSSK